MLAEPAAFRALDGSRVAVHTALSSGHLWKENRQVLAAMIAAGLRIVDTNGIERGLLPDGAIQATMDRTLAMSATAPRGLAHRASVVVPTPEDPHGLAVRYPVLDGLYLVEAPMPHNTHPYFPPQPPDATIFIASAWPLSQTGDLLVPAHIQADYLYDPKTQNLIAGTALSFVASHVSCTPYEERHSQALEDVLLRMPHECKPITWLAASLTPRTTSLDLAPASGR